MGGIIDCEMHIGDEVFVHGYIDEIRNDTIIIRNVGGYFGTSRDEVFYYEEDKYGTLNADRKTENSSEKPNNCETCRHNESGRYEKGSLSCGRCCSDKQDRATGREQQMKAEQISMLPQLSDDEDVADILRQVELFQEYARKKRKWENAFQKWSDNQDWGCCGYGSMCEWCKDNSYGRPCVRALNAMCREKGKRIDYTDFDFAKVWYGRNDK